MPCAGGAMSDRVINEANLVWVFRIHQYNILFVYSVYLLLLAIIIY